MFRPRVIPVLLLKGNGLVKTVQFRDGRYIGDPINSVRIFNDLEADELVFLDIEATRNRKRISVNLVKTIGDEAYMPFAVGGGIRDISDFHELLNAGAEKIVVNTAAVESVPLIEEAAVTFGSQSVVVSVDVKKNLFHNNLVYIRGGRTKAGLGLEELLKRVESAGAGEILINSIDRDGMMKGYDLDLIRRGRRRCRFPSSPAEAPDNMPISGSPIERGTRQRSPPEVSLCTAVRAMPY